MAAPSFLPLIGVNRCEAAGDEKGQQHEGDGQGERTRYLGATPADESNAAFASAPPAGNPRHFALP